MCALVCVIFFSCQPRQGTGAQRSLVSPGQQEGTCLAGGPAGGAGKGRLALSEAKGFGLPEGVAFPARVGSMGCNYTAPGREPVGRERKLTGGSRQAGARAARTHVTLIDSQSREWRAGASGIRSFFPVQIACS